MSHVRVLVLTFSLCVFFAVNLRGQVQKSTNSKRGDVSSTLAWLVEPEAPGSDPTVAAGPQAVVPRLMKFSGVLHDAAGKPLSGTVDVTFSLYNIESGGSPLWFETQSVQADDLGRYMALLGAMHADGLPIELFTSGAAHWLAIQVGSEAEQQPRVLLVSVPYALKAGDAETLGGKPASAYMLSESQNGTTSTTGASAATTNTVQTGSGGKARKSQTTNKSPLTACSSMTSDGTATANSIALFTTACNLQSANLVQFNGNLGFGTTTPQARLHIFGPDNTDSDARFNFILGDSTPATAGVGGGILFSGYYNGTTSRAGFANIRGIKENSIQGDYATAMVFDTRANGGNQTERMRISSAGYLGIGTTTPQNALDVNGNIATVPSAGVWLNQGRTAGITDELAGTGSITFRAGDLDQRMVITAAGNVGIGTSAPAAPLDVAGTTGVEGELVADALNLNAGAVNNHTASGRGLTFGGYGSGEGIASKRTAGGNQYGLDFYTYYNNRMSIAGPTGYVGIGTTAPGDLLDVNIGSSGSVDTGMTIEGNSSTLGDLGLKINNTGAGGINWYIDSTNSSSGYGGGSLEFVPGVGGTPVLELLSNHVILGNSGGFTNYGYVSLGCNCINESYNTYSVQISNVNNSSLNGKAISNGWDTFSSQRFKTNIHTLRGGLDKVERLRGVTYNDKSNGKPEVGVIAEEVAKVLPEIVGLDKDGRPVGLDYSRLTAVLIEATKEQQREIKAQSTLIRKQEARLASQQASLRTQHAQIVQLASQVAIIQASLKVNGQSIPTVGIAKASLPNIQTGRGSSVTPGAGAGR
ncbi:MAG TPA: tail fiber domain-containing protein [Terriglobia bacterium]|nr:tail fiber domain-containing protein [Terriglobia bacterium]